MKIIFNPFLLFLLAFIVVISCNKKPDTIGLDLVDSGKPFVGKDTTFEIRAYSVLDDSVPSDETSVNLLGSRYSETFGLNQASFYTHLRLSQVLPQFGPNPVADSIFFTMVYTGYYGDINTQLTVRMFEVEDEISRDSSYWSNISFNTLSEELANYTFVPTPNDSVEIDTTLKIAAQLKVPMNLSFAQRILDISDSSVYESSENFIEYFNGIHVVPDNVSAPGEGSILYFNLTADRSNVTIYYHNDTSAVNDSLSYTFNINNNSARVGQFVHDYEMSLDNDFKQQVLNKDTTLGEQKFYLQGMGGVRTLIKFPGVAEWIDSSSVIVNEAKLLMTPVDYGEYNEPPASLLLFELTDEDGVLAFLPDNARGETYFGGDINEVDNSYFFRISLHVQDLLKGGTDLGLSLYPNAKSIKANEASFFGTQTNSAQQFRLSIIYTRPK